MFVHRSYLSLFLCVQTERVFELKSEREREREREREEERNDAMVKSEGRNCFVFMFRSGAPKRRFCTNDAIFTSHSNMSGTFFL